MAKTAAVDRDEGKEVSLGTSKINYLDPRISFAWCKKHGIPANKIFSKTLVDKFTCKSCPVSCVTEAQRTSD